jgi:hypothetical protein
MHGINFIIVKCFCYEVRAWRQRSSKINRYFMALTEEQQIMSGGVEEGKSLILKFWEWEILNMNVKNVEM